MKIGQTVTVEWMKRNVLGEIVAMDEGNAPGSDVTLKAISATNRGPAAITVGQYTADLNPTSGRWVIKRGASPIAAGLDEFDAKEIMDAIREGQPWVHACIAPNLRRNKSSL